MKKATRVICIGIGMMAFLFSSALFQSCCRYKRCSLFDGFIARPINTLDNVTLHPNDSIQFSKFTIEILFNTHNFSCKQCNQFSVFNAAFATSCGNNDYNRIDSVKSIQISCDKDYDNNHLAGTDLNDIFNVPPRLEKFNDLYPIGKIYLTPNSSPNIEQLYSFKILIEMYHSKGYDTILPPIKLLK